MERMVFGVESRRFCCRCRIDRALLLSYSNHFQHLETKHVADFLMGRPITKNSVAPFAVCIVCILFVYLFLKLVYNCWRKGNPRVNIKGQSANY
jgi:hypothetical protein